MPNGNDLRKSLTDPKPLYFAAGVLDKIREEAPERIAAVRATDPKEVQARVSKQAKETQAKVSETLGNIDTDIKKLREQAQHLALQSLGVAAEYAVKARETYDELADRGRGAVKNWRGESGDVPEVTVEREPVKVAEPPAEPRRSTAKPGGTKAADETTSAGGTTAGATGAARRTTTAKTTTAKTGTGKAGTSGDAAKPGSAKSAAQKNGNGTAGTAGTAKSNGGRKSAPKSDS